MTIINLTQHAATPDQVAAGVLDLQGDNLQRLKALLTFDSMPSHDDMVGRADKIALLAIGAGGATRYASSVMIGGAPFFMPILQKALQDARYNVVYAFTKRVSKDVAQPDGTTTKTSVFQHAGFIYAYAS